MRSRINSPQSQWCLICEVLFTCRRPVARLRHLQPRAAAHAARAVLSHPGAEPQTPLNQIWRERGEVGITERLGRDLPDIAPAQEDSLFSSPHQPNHVRPPATTFARDHAVQAARRNGVPPIMFSVVMPAGGFSVTRAFRVAQAGELGHQRDAGPGRRGHRSRARPARADRHQDAGRGDDPHEVVPGHRRPVLKYINI